LKSLNTCKEALDSVFIRQQIENTDNIGGYCQIEKPIYTYYTTILNITLRVHSYSARFSLSILEQAGHPNIEI